MTVQHFDFCMHAGPCIKLLQKRNNLDHVILPNERGRVAKMKSGCRRGLAAAALTNGLWLTAPIGQA